MNSQSIEDVFSIKEVILLKEFIEYLNGYVQVRICGGSMERFLNLCRNNKIRLWALRKEDDCLYLKMYVRDFKKLKPIIRKTKIKISIKGRFGMPFFFEKYKKRKMFFAGILICAGMIYFLSLFFWDISIEGNAVLTDEVLYDYLESENVRFGSFKKNIDCSQIEENLRNEYDEIIWASVETRGTRLIIYIQEGLLTNRQKEVISDTPSSIYATKYGVITQMITRQGAPKVMVGQNVSPGALLVDGKVEIIGDDGSVVHTKQSQADADIYIKTTYEYQDVFPLVHDVKKRTGNRNTHYYVKVFSCVCDFVFGNHEYEKCETVTVEKQLKLWGDFYLPVFVGKIVYTEYKTEQELYEKEEAVDAANLRLNQFYENLKRKGVQIIENNVKIAMDEKNCVASGTIYVIEKNGESKPLEEMMKEDGTNLPEQP